MGQLVFLPYQQPLLANQWWQQRWLELEEYVSHDNNNSSNNNLIQSQIQENSTTIYDNFFKYKTANLRLWREKKTLMLLVIFFLIFVKAIWPKFHLPTDVFTRAETVSIRVEVDIKSKDSLAEYLSPSCVLPIMEQLHFPPWKVYCRTFFICGIKLQGWRERTKTNHIYAGKEGGIKKMQCPWLNLKPTFTMSCFKHPSDLSS